MKREEAINIVRNIYQTDAEKEALQALIPELRESEDERIRKRLLWFLANYTGRWDYPETRMACRAWLEKQEEASKAIEAIDRIDKYIDVHLANAHDMKDSNPDKKYYRGWDDALGKMAGILQDVYSDEKQKEPHYTKRNALFDECVKNCDPKTVEEVNKRVDDIMNMSELSAFEQALTNFIGYWEDDEERWPSKFVKKHGKHILDMAREELRKEQKPIYEDEYQKMLADSYNCGKDEVISNPEKYGLQKPAEWSEKHIADIFEKVGLAKIAREQGNDELTNALQDAMLELSKVENTEWSEVEVEFRGEKVKVKRPFFRDDKGRGYSTTEQDDDAAWYALRAWCEKKGVSLYDLYPRAEWNEEDEKMLARIIERGQSQIPMFQMGLLPSQIAWLKSLRPQSHWKPSEEQLVTLLRAEGIVRVHDTKELAANLAQLYEQLKKL